jgi:hypothetical protein
MGQELAIASSGAMEPRGMLSPLARREGLMQAVIGKKWLVPLECAQALHKLHPRHIAVEGGVSHGCWQFVAVILDSLADCAVWQ